jgi:large subunit ribosomal protein L29
MAFSPYSELEKLTNDAITSEIVSLKKQIFELRLKKATRQSFKPHAFKHLKRKIAQLQTIQSKRDQTLQ